jgi:hypothetical protein
MSYNIVTSNWKWVKDVSFNKKSLNVHILSHISNTLDMDFHKQLFTIKN